MNVYCSRCGKEQPDTATHCSQCNATLVTPMDESAHVVQDKHSRLKNIALAIACGLYLVYPSFSVFELIPDAIPVLGSLDEASATAGLLYALSNLGWIPWRSTKTPDSKSAN